MTVHKTILWSVAMICVTAIICCAIMSNGNRYVLCRDVKTKDAILDTKTGTIGFENWTIPFGGPFVSTKKK